MKLLKVGILSTFMATQALATGARVEYKVSDSIKKSASFLGLSLTTLSVGSYSTSKYDKLSPKSKIWQALIGITGSGLSLVGGTGSMVSGKLATYYYNNEALFSPDNEEIRKQYFALKGFITDSFYVREINKDRKFQQMLKRYECKNCKSDLDKIDQLHSLFKKLENLADEVIESGKYNSQNANDAFKDPKLPSLVTETIRENPSVNNLDLAYTLFALIYVARFE